MNEPLGLLDTHFLEGRQYRVEELDDARAQLARAHGRNKVLVGLLAGCMAGLVYLGSLPKQIPYVVKEEGGTGRVQAVGPASKDYQPSADTIRLYLREQIYALRGISEDKELMRQFWRQALARTTKKGRLALLAYEEKWKPLDQREPIRVEVQHYFARTKMTYDVRWTETRFNDKREVVSTVRYAGLFIFETHIPQTQEERDYSPAGIFFDSWQWSTE